MSVPQGSAMAASRPVPHPLRLTMVLPNQLTMPTQTTPLTTPTDHPDGSNCLPLSITKLSPRRGPRTHSAKASTVGWGGETSFQQDVTSFPGGDSMLEVLTRLQGHNEQLNQQLEVSTCLTHSTNHVKCGMK